ncbi:MAG: SurA N-terminal domain-containing protein [Dehalococcoidia bacterium]
MVDLTPNRQGAARLDRRRVEMLNPRSRKRQRLVIITILLAFVIVTAIFIASYIIAFVIPPKKLVVRVNDVEYTRGELVEQVRIRQKSAEFMGGTFDPSSAVFESLQRMVENEIINQIAPTIGITVTEEEIDRSVDIVMRPGSNQTLGKSEAQIVRETQERYRHYLNTVQIDEETHRHIVSNTALREKFRQYVGNSVPFVAEQVHLYRLVMPSDGETEIMKIKFQDAVRDAVEVSELEQAYVGIVREFSQDLPETVRNGGELGWIAEDVIPEYEYMFFDLEPGELSEAVHNRLNTDQFFYFMISERQLARELSLSVRDDLKTEALQKYLNEERKLHDVYAVFNSDIYSWVFGQLMLSAATETPTADSSQSFLDDF